jgi:hypothetical protein
MIRTADWDRPAILCTFDKEPTEDNKKDVIREYWHQFERGLYEEFNAFMEELKTAGLEQTTPYKKGIWTEKIAHINN